MRPGAGVRLRAFYIDYFASPGLGYEDAVRANRVSRDSNPVAPTDARAKTPGIQTRFGEVLRTGRPLARNRRFVDLWSGNSLLIGNKQGIFHRFALSGAGELQNTSQHQ
jgi:hypothetical protein